MPISEVHHVALSVSDLERSIAFYCEVLGFRRALDLSMGGTDLGRMLGVAAGTKARSVILAQGASTVGEIELMQFDPPLRERTRPKQPGDPGVFLLSFEVKDEELQAVYERLRARGIEFRAEPQSVLLEGYGTIQALLFEDPDGVIIELVQLPSREEVRHHRQRNAG